MSFQPLNGMESGCCMMLLRFWPVFEKYLSSAIHAANTDCQAG